MREVLQRSGFGDFVGPVRPTGKADLPHLPMEAYVRARRRDGLPAVPWLRVHVRLGALVPVHVDVAQDHAVYVEPNVWVHHRLWAAGPRAAHRTARNT